MCVDAEDIAYRVKHGTMLWVKEHIDEYRFSVSESGDEVRKSIDRLSFVDGKCSDEEEVEECYDLFFANFDNNIFKPLYQIRSGQITCGVWQGYFVVYDYEGDYLYIPLEKYVEFQKEKESGADSPKDRCYEYYLSVEEHVLGAKKAREKNYEEAEKKFKKYRDDFLKECKSFLKRYETMLTDKYDMLDGALSIGQMKVLMGLGIFVGTVLTFFSSLLNWLIGALVFGLMVLTAWWGKQIIRKYQMIYVADNIVKKQGADSAEEIREILQRKERFAAESYGWNELEKALDRSGIDWIKERMDEKWENEREEDEWNGNRKNTIRHMWRLGITGLGFMMMVGLLAGIDHSRINEMVWQDLVDNGDREEDFPTGGSPEIVETEDHPVEELPVPDEPETDFVIGGWQDYTYVVAADAHIRQIPDVTGEVEGYLATGESVRIVDQDDDGDKKLWYKIELAYEKYGWVNRKVLRRVYPEEIKIVTAKFKGGKIEIPELYDGYIESALRIRPRDIDDRRQIVLGLERKTAVKGIIIYPGYYRGDFYDQYGKISKIAISFDGENEVIRSIDTSYNVEGYFVPIEGDVEAKEITITLMGMELGNDKNGIAEERAYLSEVIVIGK